MNNNFIDLIPKFESALAIGFEEASNFTSNIDSSIINHQNIKDLFNININVEFFGDVNKSHNISLDKLKTEITDSDLLIYCYILQIEVCYQDRFRLTDAEKILNKINILLEEDINLSKSFWINRIINIGNYLTIFSGLYNDIIKPYNLDNLKHDQKYGYQIQSYAMFFKATVGKVNDDFRSAKELFQATKCFFLDEPSMLDHMDLYIALSYLYLKDYQSALEISKSISSSDYFKAHLFSFLIQAAAEFGLKNNENGIKAYNNFISVSESRNMNPTKKKFHKNPYLWLLSQEIALKVYSNNSKIIEKQKRNTWNLYGSRLNQQEHCDSIKDMNRRLGFGNLLHSISEYFVYLNYLIFLNNSDNKVLQNRLLSHADDFIFRSLGFIESIEGKNDITELISKTNSSSALKGHLFFFNCYLENYPCGFSIILFNGQLRFISIKKEKDKFLSYILRELRNNSTNTSIKSINIFTNKKDSPSTINFISKISKEYPKIFFSIGTGLKRLNRKLDNLDTSNNKDILFIIPSYNNKQLLDTSTLGFFKEKGYNCIKNDIRNTQDFFDKIQGYNSIVIIAHGEIDKTDNKQWIKFPKFKIHLKDIYKSGTSTFNNKNILLGICEGGKNVDSDINNQEKYKGSSFSFASIVSAHGAKSVYSCKELWFVDSTYKQVFNNFLMILENKPFNDIENWTLHR